MRPREWRFDFRLSYTFILTFVKKCIPYRYTSTVQRLLENWYIVLYCIYSVYYISIFVRVYANYTVDCIVEVVDLYQMCTDCELTYRGIFFLKLLDKITFKILDISSHFSRIQDP